MYEIVKTVNGHDITRMKGTHGVYHVKDKAKLLGKNISVTHTFKTIKSAVAFCETLK